MLVAVIKLVFILHDISCQPTSSRPNGYHGWHGIDIVRGDKYPAGKEPRVSVTVLKLLKRVPGPGSMSVLGVRGSLTSRGTNNEGDAGCDRSWGRDTSIDTSSNTARSPSSCDPSLINGPLEGAFAAGGSWGLRRSLSNKLLKYSNSNSLRDSSSNRNFCAGSLPLLIKYEIWPESPWRSSFKLGSRSSVWSRRSATLTSLSH